MNYLLVFVALLANLLPSASYAQVYKCTVNGQVAFQDKPCGGEARRGMEVLHPESQRPLDKALAGVAGIRNACTKEVLAYGFDRAMVGPEVIILCGEAAGVSLEEAMALRPGGTVLEQSPKKGMKFVQWIREDGIKYRLEWLSAIDQIETAGLIPPTEGRATTSDPKIQMASPRDKVYEEIKVRCIDQWPENYRQQRYCIDEETKAYRDVHGPE